MASASASLAMQALACPTQAELACLTQAELVYPTQAELVCPTLVELVYPTLVEQACPTAVELACPTPVELALQTVAEPVSLTVAMAWRDAMRQLVGEATKDLIAQQLAVTQAWLVLGVESAQVLAPRPHHLHAECLESTPS